MDTEQVNDWFGKKTSKVAEGVIGITEFVLTGEILAKLFGYTTNKK